MGDYWLLGCSKDVGLPALLLLSADIILRSLGVGGPNSFYPHDFILRSPSEVGSEGGPLPVLTF